MGIVVRRTLARKIRQKNLTPVQVTARFDFGQQLCGIVRTGELHCPIETACRTQHDAHLMPHVRQAMTKRMDGAVRIRQEARSDQEEHARGAERKERIACLDDTDPCSAGCVVTAATCNRDARHAPRFGNFG
jgi:hypothetical protein